MLDYAERARIKKRKREEELSIIKTRIAFICVALFFVGVFCFQVFVIDKRWDEYEKSHSKEIYNNAREQITREYNGVNYSQKEIDDHIMAKEEDAN